jgi:hypothetical protein
MQTNVGSIDKIARILLGIALLGVGFGVLQGTLGTVIGVVGLVPIATALLGFCPAYKIFGISSCPLKD